MPTKVVRSAVAVPTPTPDRPKTPLVLNPPRPTPDRPKTPLVLNVPQPQSATLGPRGR